MTHRPAIAAALLVWATTVAAGCSSAEDSREPMLQPEANQRLVGAWRPTGVKPIEGVASRWRLVFDEDGLWRGIDGCQKVQGVFSLREDGTFDGGQTPGDFEGGGACEGEQLYYYEIFGETARVDISRDRAVFMAADGDELLVLVRLS